MNHLLRVVLVLCLAAIGVAALLISYDRANPYPAYESVVQEYVAYRRSTTMPSLTIKQVVQARLPQSFRSDMSKLSFGDATYYTTDRHYRPYPTVDALSSYFTTTRATTADAKLFPIGSGGGRPLPYPPNDVWCAQLSSPDPTAPTVVVAALHQDIFNAEWIVHEVSDPETVLAAIGCQFAGQ